MPSAFPLSDTDLAAALDGAACLGPWSYDVSADRFSVARPLGSALDLSPWEMAGATLPRILSAIQREDAARIAGLFSAAAETGGPFEAEFRTWGRGRGTRWFRLMGRTERDGGIRTRGLAFDLTEGRLGGRPARGAQWQANQLAEHVIAMKGLVPPLDNPSLARLVDRLAVEVGFELARRLREAGEARH